MGLSLFEKNLVFDNFHEVKYDYLCIVLVRYEVGGLPQWLSDKESACNAGDSGDTGLILDQKDTLMEGIATHSSILAWRIPWTEEPGRLQSIWIQRTGHD